MVEAYREYWNNYFNFSGKMSRKNFWLNVLINFIIYIILIMCTCINIGEPISGYYALLTIVYSLATIIPNISMQVRRLHDTGQSGACVLLCFIPIIGSIILIVFYSLPSVYTQPYIQNNNSVNLPSKLNEHSIFIITLIIGTLMIIFISILIGIEEGEDYYNYLSLKIPENMTLLIKP